jgi:hypothetical protein
VEKAPGVGDVQVAGPSVAFVNVLLQLGGLRRDTDHKSGPWRAAVLPAVGIALLALVPRCLTAGRFETTDEVLWMQRSLDFSDALFRFDPAAASATTGPLSTMPGVTTMWLGTAARAIRWAAARFGLVDGSAAFTASPLGLHLAQLAMAFATSALIGIVVLLAWRWSAPAAALTAGVLLATEPFLVAHGAVLHTDALTGLFGAAGVLALLLALEIPDSTAGRPRLLAALGGVLLAGSFLTKLSGLSLLPGLALVVGAAMADDARRGWRSGRSLADTLRQRSSLLVLCGVAAVAASLSWPALWADPVRQLRFLRQSAGQGRMPHATFFLGRITSTPGPLFYAVATPLRMTPWFLLGSLVLIPVALALGRRRHAVILLVSSASVVAVLSAAARQMDRYILTTLPLVALACGLGLEAVVARTRRWFDDTPRLALAVGLAATALLMVHAVWIAPWGLAYFNPLLGGSRVAEKAILVGWGEGLELAGDWIREREAPSCNVTIALNYPTLTSAFPCGNTTRDVDAADYFVLYVNHRQRLADDWMAAVQRRSRLVDVVSIRGIDYAEIYDLRESPGPGASGPAAAAGAQVLRR